MRVIFPSRGGQVLGLTGLAGSGKSTVSSLLKEKGFVVIDVDLLVQEVVQEEREWLHENLGIDPSPSIPVSDVKKQIAKIVFSNEELFNKWEEESSELLWEKVVTRIEATNPDDVVVIDYALLGYIGFNYICRLILCVTAPWHDRLARVEKSGWDANILGQRDSRIEHTIFGDLYIHNDSDVEMLQKNVSKFADFVLASRVRYAAEQGRVCL